MNGNFRIIKEDTQKKKDGKLIVILTAENTKYGVEVVNDKEGFGRKYTPNKAEAELLFDSICERISFSKTIAEASDLIQKCFSFKSMDKIVLVLLTDGKTVNQKFIVSLRKKINFRAAVKLNYKYKKKKNGSLTVFISSTLDSKPFGVFIGKDDAKKLKFELL